MPLAIIFVILFLLKILDIPPVGNWSWMWVLTPFVLLMLWWNVITPMIGWDKKMAEKKMKEDAKEADETKRKNRGF
ncbi:MAG: TIGR04438 family Trp-rich protein [Betaproteobacteria bacterium]